jgi:ferredoxin
MNRRSRPVKYPLISTNPYNLFYTIIFLLFIRGNRMARVFVEKSLCVGCGLCTSICDDVFRSDADGKSEVLLDADATLPCVREAAEGCPSEAIIIEEF